MTRKTTAIVLGLILAGMPLSRAAADVKTALAGVPADAAGFICLPNLKHLDADIQEAITNLGLDAMIAPPMNSIVTMMKMNLPMLAGVDESKPVAYVIMPIQTIQDLDSKSALVFSSADPKAMLEGLAGTAGEDGVWSVNLMGQAQAAAIKGSTVVIGKMPEIVRAIAESKSSIAAKMPNSDLAGMDALDVAIWVDGEKLFTPLKPMLNGVLMMSMMQLQAQGANPATMDQARKGFEELIDGLGSLTIGMSVQNEGLGIRIGMTAKPGSDFAKKFKFATTEGSLLDGLPGSAFMLAGGQVSNEAQAKAIADDVAQLGDVYNAVEGMDQEKFKEFIGIATEMSTLYRGMRVSIEGLEPGAGGLFGFSMIVNSTDAKRMIELKKKAITLGKAIFKEVIAASGDADIDEVTQVLDAISFKTGADRVGGAEVMEFMFDLEKVAEIAAFDEEDLTEIKEVIGKEGLLFRGAAIDGKTIVTSFGGGKARFAALVGQARSNSAPLAAHEGIKALASRMPKSRSFALYVAPDEILKTVQNVQRVFGEEPVPVQLPKLNAPLAINSTGGDGWSQLDIFVPTKLIRAIKDATMGAAAAPQSGPAADEPTDAP